MAPNGDSMDREDTAPLMDYETGLPLMTEEEQDQEHAKMCKMVTILTIVPRVVAGAIAFLIYWLDSDKYDNRMKAINLGGTLELGYAYIAIGFLNFVGFLLNNYPMTYKALVMDGKAGNLRSNMMIYKVNFLEEKKLPYVVLEEEGDIGVYNRSNRALTHFIENTVGLILCIAASLVIFSVPAMVVVIIFGLGRLLYQMRYAEGGYGPGGHLPPFLICFLSSMIIEMLTWGAGIRMLMLA
eukprot:gnl/MRDRNA2_/MRDRNA2_74702_c0_seq1.p1 gnl/MRDRNA2_/MRDRNA2_74702_c0~~gnl/MRDRNA2_/MRDRNA2_74702_c0_seq1.p1  ORF type:complete len:240 (+),score=43.04 gnl/MRDRNA2_/MRDRNA2_74702_c0_seq1:92-811(+)